jgi:acyl-CoA reductase-like NAD-dependent aldehyde dehydrogenase
MIKEQLPFAGETARARQSLTVDIPLAERLAWVQAARRLFVERAEVLAQAVQADVQRDPGEVFATDLLPSASAARYLVRSARGILREQRPGGRPLWLFGTRDTIHRRPHGIVGVIGTWNYPIFLNAVPILQALTAGNAVLWKPSEFAPRSATVLAQLFHDAGVPAERLQMLPATRDNGPLLAEADLNFVHFTGSDTVGRKLAARLGERLIPSVLELSGVDAVLVRPDANFPLAARSAWYGATLNAGQTCIACRRLFVPQDHYQQMLELLRPLVEQAPATPLVSPGQAKHAEALIQDAEQAGCTVLRSPQRSADGSGNAAPFAPALILGEQPTLRFCHEATFAPILGLFPYANEAALLEQQAACDFGLSGAIFTADVEAGAKLAARMATGSVVLNDVITPVANPITPFGGRGRSGWGPTQGADGLLAMTIPQVVTVRSGTFRPHVDAGLKPDPATAQMIEGVLRMGHGGWRDRWRGFWQIVAAARGRGAAPG